MLFPAIREAWSELRSGLGAKLLGLDTKAATALATLATGMSNDEYTFLRRFPTLLAAYGAGQPSWSGETITDQTVLNNSVAWACTRVISESEAFLPLNMMLSDPSGTKDVAVDHPAHQGLHNAPNDEMTSMAFRESRTAHMVTGGNCYAKIHRRSGTGTAYEFEPLSPVDVIVGRDQSKRLAYEVAGDKTYTVERGKPHDILHIRGLGFDGLVGYSVITMARQSLGTAQSVERYAGRYFATGGRQPGYLKPTVPFRTKEDRDKFREDMEGFLHDPNNYHRWPIFPPGVEFESYGWGPQDSQFLETRQWTVPEICRWFLVSPHIVCDLTHATFSNVEHLGLQFVKMTLTPWLTRWEQDLWRCVLTPAEKVAGYYFKHNVNGLLRGDFQSRMAGYSTLLQNGIANIDEVRDLEDWNELPNGSGKAHHIQLNMATVPGTGQPTATELAAIAKYTAALGEGGKANEQGN